MKLLLLGKSGMLGSCFLKHLAGMEGVEVFAMGREELDICDFEKVRETVLGVKPDLLINCTAYTNVDLAESEKEKAMLINGECCGVLAETCKEAGSALLHFSTDYVFSGDKSDGYGEEDEPRPLNVYGASKLEGERQIRETMEKYHIVRTSWLYGENGKNFVSTMLGLAKEKSELDIVDDQIGSPTFTGDLCKAVIENFIKKSSTFGIYHLSNCGTASWYDFAAKIFELAKIDMKLNRTTSDRFVRPAKRPAYSILLNHKLPPLRTWQEGLQAYLSLILPKNHF